MPFEAVSFTEVTTEGLESSPVAEALASLRANEARYFSNKYKHTFTVTPAAEAQDVLRWVEEILESGREIVPTSPALEVSINDVDGVYWVEAARPPRDGGGWGWRLPTFGRGGVRGLSSSGSVLFKFSL